VPLLVTCRSRVLRAAATVGEWQVCGDCFYSRELLCSMQWHDLELDTHRYAPLAHGLGDPTLHDP
jgi:hypothetical protein